MALILHVVAYPSALSAPTAAQIAAGQDVNSNAAPYYNGGQTWTGSGQFDDATGLSHSTSYRFAAVIYDSGASAYSNVVVSGAWTTAVDLVASPIAIAGTAAVSGDIQIGTSHDLSATPIALTGALSATGDLEIGTSSSALGIWPGGGGSKIYARRRQSVDDDIEDGELRRVREEDQMVIDCITAIVVTGVL
jgi:hypothetical protein